MAMIPAALARQLLIDAAGDALCDACLALACGTSLTEMHQITRDLAADNPSIRRGAACASCGRTVPSIFYQTDRIWAPRNLCDDSWGISWHGHEFGPPGSTVFEPDIGPTPRYYARYWRDAQRRADPSAPLELGADVESAFLEDIAISSV